MRTIFSLSSPEGGQVDTEMKYMRLDPSPVFIASCGGTEKYVVEWETRIYNEYPYSIVNIQPAIVCELPREKLVCYFLSC